MRRVTKSVRDGTCFEELVYEKQANKEIWCNFSILWIELTLKGGYTLPAGKK